MKSLLALVAWCLLFVLCWPVALLALLLWPVVWLVSLPLRVGTHAIEQSVPSRGGFGSSAHFFGRLG